MPFFTKDIAMGPDGKPVFVGKEEPSPKVEATKGAQMQCPVCRGWFDYLVGDDTNDGGKRGCEGCWKPSQRGGQHGTGAQRGTEAEVEEVIS